MEQNRLSVVVPMLNEQGNIEELYRELTHVVRQLRFFASYELIFVNDGSSDQTLSIAKRIALNDPCAKIISFTRNFGHEHATYAGICHALGDAVVLIDADRQDPPVLILEFEKEFASGTNIVYGQRTERLNESWLKKVTSKAFYPLFRWMTRVDLPNNVGDFCMMSRRAVDALLALPERTLFIRGMIYWSGLSKKAVPFVRRPRGAGTTTYNYSKLTIFALENIISFSMVPLHWIIFLSLLIIGVSVGSAVVTLAMSLLGYARAIGWLLVLCGMIFLCATMLLAVGIVGLYVGKIFQEIKQRPIFIVDEYVNFDKKTGPRLSPGRHYTKV
ncbi:MAG: glycosyltransferase family 2 protein [Candidatus Babeliales bacterium]